MGCLGRTIEMTPRMIAHLQHDTAERVNIITSRHSQRLAVGKGSEGEPGVCPSNGACDAQGGWGVLELRGYAG